MEPRMTQPAMVVPGAMDALQALGAALREAGPTLPLELTNLRASQINGCSVCVDGHSHALRKDGESDERLFSVAAWREAPWFDDDERAALALAEAITRLDDRPGAVSDEIWEAARAHYDEQELATLVLSIAAVNLWNRLNAATHQVAGSWRG
jgi:AhpD family alkylhydroperoxidase